MQEQLIPIDLDHVSHDETVDMPLRGDEKAWIKTEIANAIAASSKPTGSRRFLRWLRDWSLVGVNISVIVALLLGLLTAVYVVVNRATAEAKFETSTNDRLNSIETNLRILTASQAPEKVLQELSRLNEKQFEVNLPALKTVAEQPVAKVAPTPAILRDLGLKLQNVDESAKSTSGYWLTVLQFIQFASASYAPDVPPSGGLVNVNLKDAGGIEVPPHGTYRLEGKITDMTFTNSRILFTDQPAFLGRVRFINCAFEFPKTLSPSLQNTGQELLASGIKTAYVAGM